MKKLLAILLGLVPVSAMAQSDAMEEPAVQDINETRGNVAIIRQSGSGNNVVKIQQSGDHNTAEIYQDGANNEADVTQEGGSNELNATQTGEDNKLKRHQTGHTRTTITQNGKMVTYDENGDVVVEH